MCNHQAEDQVVAQNDIADLLGKLIALLVRIRGIFDRLVVQAEPQALPALGPCEQAFVDAHLAKLKRVLAELPGEIQSYVNCKLGFTTQQAQAVGIGSLFALLKYLPQILQYLPQLIAILQQIGQLLPAAPASPAAPSGPVDPSAAPQHRDVKRCP